MADEGDLVAVMVLGFVVLSYAILFYLCDKEYRNNFGLTIEDVSTVDTVAITVEKAKDQFNQMALRFDKLKVCKKWRDMINNLYRKKYTYTTSLCRIYAKSYRKLTKYFRDRGPSE